MFPGTVMHTHSYREPSPFAGQRVVVVGASASGVDISREIAQVAKKVRARRYAACQRQPECLDSQISAPVSRSQTLAAWHRQPASTRCLRSSAGSTRVDRQAASRALLQHRYAAKLDCPSHGVKACRVCDAGQVFLSARSWTPEDTAHAKPFGDNSNIHRVPGFQTMDRDGAVHFAGGRSVPCVDTVGLQPHTLTAASTVTLMQQASPPDRIPS